MTFLEALRIVCGLQVASAAERQEAAQRVREYAVRVATGCVYGSSQGRVDEAEDLAQDAFLALLRNGRPDQAETEPEAWSYVATTVKRLWLKRMSRAAREPRTPSRAEEDGEVSPLDRVPAPVSAQPDHVAEARQQAERYDAMKRWLLEVLVPAIAATIAAEGGRVSFLRVIDELRGLREETVTLEELHEEELGRPGRGPGPRTPKQASDAIDRRFANARARILEMMQALESERGRSTPAQRKFATLRDVAVALARRLHAEHPEVALGLGALRVAVEWLCYERVKAVWRDWLD